MPNINSMRSSKFLKKEDCEPPVLLTIAGCSQENVAKEGAPEDLKWAIHFKETDKPMIANSTNLQIIAKVTGSEETEDWEGHRIVLYNDPNVSYAGKLIGGIRVRAPKKGTPAAAPLVPEEDDDEVPF